MPRMEEEFSRPSGEAALWYGVLCAPVIFFLQFEAAFAVVPWACAKQETYLLFLIHLAGIVIAGSGAFVAWQSWRKVGKGWPEDAEGVLPRSRFMALGGFILSLSFVLVMLWQATATSILGPCT